MVVVVEGMVEKIYPKNEEVCLRDNEFIVSKTCPKGRITYINRCFMRISSFREEQLLDAPHSIIRHPDMPRGVFRLMWNTLQKGEEFFGFVKNMCADGRYYWVFANVTPDLDERGKLKGYYSVRRKPTRRGIEAVVPVYREMLAIEGRQSRAAAAEASMEYLQEVLDKAGVSYSQFALDLYGEGAEQEGRTV